MGDTPSPPPQPDVGQETADAVNAQMNAYPVMLQEQMAANLGQQYTAPNGATYDFSGMGQQAQLNQDLALYDQSTTAEAQQQLSLQQQFGSQEVSQAQQEIQQYDPTRYALNQNLEQTAETQLAAGTSMTPDQDRLAQQQARAAQTARGNIMGPNPAIDEAFSQYNMGQQLLGQREQAAGMALGLTTNTQQAGQLSATQNGAVGTNSMLPQTAVQLGSPQAIQTAAMQTGAQQYATAMQGYNYQLNAPNPWLQGIGAASQLIGSVSGLAAM